MLPPFKIQSMARDSIIMTPLVTLLIVATLALTLVSAGLPSQAADEPLTYGKVTASAGGTGKTFAGREIAQVMSWHGAAWLERPERTREERPDLLLPLLPLVVPPWIW